MTDFKYIVGQEVVIDSKDRNLSGKKVKVATRAVKEEENYYKVTGDGILGALSFFENQLKVA